MVICTYIMIGRISMLNAGKIYHTRYHVKCIESLGMAKPSPLLGCPGSRKLGSKVIGPVGYVTPIYAIYKFVK